MLVAITIPVFTAQLEKSREATDEANIRSIYAQLSADVISENTSASATDCPTAASYSVAKSGSVVTGTATYTMTQSENGTANGGDITVGGVKITSANFKTGTCTIVIKDNGDAPSITIGVSVKTVESWECGRTHPTGPAYRLINFLEHNPNQIQLLPFISIE